MAITVLDWWHQYVAQPAFIWATVGIPLGILGGVLNWFVPIDLRHPIVDLYLITVMLAGFVVAATILLSGFTKVAVDGSDGGDSA